MPVNISLMESTSKVITGIPEDHGTEGNMWQFISSSSALLKLFFSPQGAGPWQSQLSLTPQTGCGSPLLNLSSASHGPGFSLQ